MGSAEPASVTRVSRVHWSPLISPCQRAPYLALVPLLCPACGLISGFMPSQWASLIFPAWHLNGRGSLLPSTEARMARHLLSRVLGAGTQSCDPGLSKQMLTAEPVQLDLARQRSRGQLHHLQQGHPLSWGSSDTSRLPWAAGARSSDLDVAVRSHLDCRWNETCLSPLAARTSPPYLAVLCKRTHLPPSDILCYSLLLYVLFTCLSPLGSTLRGDDGFCPFCCWWTPSAGHTVATQTPAVKSNT